eukprot:1158393-Pelagomonas_calceolata.AAC.3
MPEYLLTERASQIAGLPLPVGAVSNYLHHKKNVDEFMLGDESSSFLLPVNFCANLRLNGKTFHSLLQASQGNIRPDTLSLACA